MDRDEDRRHRVEEDELGPQQVVPDGRTVPHAGDQLYGNQRNSANKEKCFSMSLPPARVEAELNKVEDADRCRSRDGQCRTGDGVTVPGKRFTSFSIERLLYG